MKAYRFRLETVARVRQLQEQAAGQRLALASPRDRQLARSAWNEARHALDALPAPAGRTDAGTVQWSYDQADRMAGHVLRRAAALQAADAALAEARSDWEVAKQRCTALERLDLRQRGRWQAELDHHEATELDDLTTVRYAVARGDR